MRRRTLVVATGVVAVAAGFGLWAVVTDWRWAGTALPGVTLEGRAVGRLDPAELAALVETIAAPTVSRPMEVKVAGLTSTTSPARLGMSPQTHRAVAGALGIGRSGPYLHRLLERAKLLAGPIDVRIAYDYDPVRARQEIDRIAAAAVSEPKDAVVAVANDRLAMVAPSQDGVVVDERASLIRTIAAMQRGDPAVELIVTFRRPAFTTEDADRIAEPIAQFTTRFPYNADRVHNIQLAAGALRGVLMAPGDHFSFNQMVGPRDPDRGYRKAPILYNNILIPGDGGGVCQVSSTLFNAALLAEMTVEARTNHSQPVPYLPAGLDATVDYGVLDLRLRNTTGSYLYLWTEVRTRSLTVTVFGARAPGRTVELVVRGQPPIPAPTHTVTVRDPYLAPGQTREDAPKPGLRARTYRLIRVDGQVVREEVVTSSYYRPVPRTIRIGAADARESQNLRRTTAP